MRKTLAAAALGATLMGGTMVGAATLLPNVVGAQTGSTTTSAPSATAPDAAQRQQSHTDRLNSALQPLVDNGTITSTQRDAVVQSLQSAKGGAMKGGMKGHGMEGGMLDRGMMGGIGAAADAVAKALDTDTATLRTELQAGKSLADIAKGKGVDVQKVVDAITTELNAKIDAAVTAGKMTAEQATARKADVATHVTELVNGTMPSFGHRGPRGDMNGGQAPAQNQGSSFNGSRSSSSLTA